jgi:4,5-DOPA dioxygenase extradiol
MPITPSYHRQYSEPAGSVIYLPHGGGPLPLLGEPRHRELVEFLQQIPATLVTPSAIVLISAHWEKSLPTITGGAAPPLLYDYYGFPEEAYSIAYPAPGEPRLARSIHRLLEDNGITAGLDDRRGFDHGLFIPLKIMYPKADIPCVQLSLLTGLRPDEHLRLGRALGQLRRENLLIIGSGFSFHNLQAFFQTPTEEARTANANFEKWLFDTFADKKLSEEERQERLLHWRLAPGADFCHPRAEHLLPLHVCYGIAGRAAARIYRMEIMGKKASAYIW